MHSIIRIVSFIIVFSTTFTILRLSNFIDVSILNQNLNGISWLYSVIGLIFGIISAFIIQTQWNKWDKLVGVVDAEINSLRELFMLSDLLPMELGKEIRKSIKDYLISIIDKEGWKQVDQGKRSEEVELALEKLRKAIFHLIKDTPKRGDIASSLLLTILKYRNIRLHLSSDHSPFLLHVTIVFATFLVVILSFFIAVPNFWLDYLFTMGVALLAFLIYAVIEDLDHPYRPGSWHLSKDNYKNLLQEIERLK